MSTDNFKSAIAQLEVSAETAETNVPKWEVEGNHEQADASREHAQSYRAAIEQLQAT